MLRKTFVPMLAVVLALAGCGSGSDGISGTGRFSVTGSWTSTAAIGQFSNFRLQLTQASNGSIIGTWTATSANGGGAGALDVTGNVTGINNANSVTLNFEQLTGSFTGTATSTSRMQGTLSAGANTPVAATFTR